MATILLVEDEASMRLLTCAKLKHQFTIVCAKDGVEALELLEPVSYTHLTLPTSHLV